MANDIFGLKGKRVKVWTVGFGPSADKEDEGTVTGVLPGIGFWLDDNVVINTQFIRKIEIVE